ncbi:hypothetical protein EYF80_055190 [Liparis tanakae]|uniref:Uncharacterized protein n=1 Tax=Liparis tanakae TaxID=230148 RepID=A0A4Z2F0B6_9TELE|nr:hypothetical protein EYF80_055190 [Liparis tanakae]
MFIVVSCNTQLEFKLEINANNSHHHGRKCKAGSVEQEVWNRKYGTGSRKCLTGSGSGGRPRVALHVRLQAVALREGLVAQRALVGSLPAVRAHVHGEVGLACAGFAADAADEGLEAGVHRHVVVQVHLALEGPAALLAAVRRLPGVDPRVDGQRPFGGEAAAALAAAVRLLAAVRPQVDLQLLAGEEHLAADVAEVRALAVRGVDLLVLPQRAGQLEAPAAHRAAVGSLPGVRGLVAAQGPVVAEGFAAHAAEVRRRLLRLRLLGGGVRPAAAGGRRGALRLRPLVELLVNCQRRLRGERGAADVALVGFLPRGGGGALGEERLRPRSDAGGGGGGGGGRGDFAGPDVSALPRPLVFHFPRRLRQFGVVCFQLFVTLVLFPMAAAVILLFLLFLLLFNAMVVVTFALRRPPFLALVFLRSRASGSCLVFLLLGGAAGTPGVKLRLRFPTVTKGRKLFCHLRTPRPMGSLRRPGAFLLAHLWRPAPSGSGSPVGSFLFSCS